MSFNKKPWFILKILATLLLGVTSCKEKRAQEASAIIAVTKPWRDKVVIDRQYVAQIHAIQHIDIRAFEKGYLQNIYIDEGQSVKKDTKMFQIMPFLMKAEYNKAKAEYEIAKIEYVNTKKLNQENVVSQNELALAKAKFDKFAAELDLAKTHLDLTVIKAPFNGLIDRFRVRLGSLVEEGELLTTLSDIDRLWVYFNMSESDYLNFVKAKTEKGVGASVKLVLANGNLYKYPGQIDTIEADFNNETGNIPFRATFQNPEHLLRHGETGNVLLSTTIDNALLIPQKATFEILDKRFVYVVNNKGIIDSREIVIDKEIAHLFIVKSGLTDQDTLVLEGLGKLRKGSKIRSKPLSKTDVMNSLRLEAN